MDHCWLAGGWKLHSKSKKLLPASIGKQQQDLISLIISALEHGIARKSLKLVFLLSFHISCDKMGWQCNALSQMSWECNRVVRGKERKEKKSSLPCNSRAALLKQNSLAEINWGKTKAATDKSASGASRDPHPLPCPYNRNNNNNHYYNNPNCFSIFPKESATIPPKVHRNCCFPKPFWPQSSYHILLRAPSIGWVHIDGNAKLGFCIFIVLNEYFSKTVFASWSFPLLNCPTEIAMVWSQKRRRGHEPIEIILLDELQMNSRVQSVDGEQKLRRRE